MKYILGVSGWPKRSHDASACIVRGGKILAMAEEERFIRKKKAFDKVPINSTLWCLEKVGVSLNEIDIVSFGWDYPRLCQLAGLKVPPKREIFEKFFPKKYFEYSNPPTMEFVSHHMAHAASAFYLSGMQKSSILVVDGQGEDVSTTLAYGIDNKIKIIDSLPVECSLGYFYDAVTQFVGLGPEAAGKLMGLSSYGNPKYNFDELKLTSDGLKIDLNFKSRNQTLDQQEQVVNAWVDKLEKTFDLKKPVSRKFNSLYGKIDKKTKITNLQQNIAASAQKKLEDVMVHLVKLLINKTGEDNLCISGGVALNCSANTKVHEMDEVNDLFIPPPTNDGGVSLGAALLSGGVKSSKRLNHAYFGPDYEDKEIKIILDKYGFKYEKCDDIKAKVVDLLIKGNIVSWFQGRMEMGPRALGNRSILGDPRSKKNLEKTNIAKSREQWRPLAPSILEERANEVLKMDGMRSSPFMLHTFTVREEIKKKIPAVVHVDGTTRPQTVSNENNPKYYDLIKLFFEKTGVPLVLNTSFNGSGEPIVCTPYDALVSFFSNTSDFLALGDFLVYKK